MIKLKCINPECAYSYSVSEKELEYNQKYHKTCLICGSLMKVDNLKEIVRQDIYNRAEEYINEWVSKIGWDRTLDLIKKYKDNPIYRIYKEILGKRGFKIK
jgi:hypothetical protein